MSFPENAYERAGDYLTAYRQALLEAWQSVDPQAVNRATDMLAMAINAGRIVFACGNGGSAAIANHLACDWMKGIQTDTPLRPRVISLATTIELITAIADDIAYAEVFVYQLRSLAQPGDVLITISASGNSENIVRVIGWARDHGIGSIALTGFDGGRSAGLTDVKPARARSELRHCRGRASIAGARFGAVSATPCDSARIDSRTTLLRALTFDGWSPVHHARAVRSAFAAAKDRPASRCF
jgi:phosphoheptose isomerase